jgi:hypothetical protein
MNTVTLPRWVPILALVGASLTAAGGLIALVRPELLLSGGTTMNPAAHLYADYLVSRNLALAALLFAALALRARRMLGCLMALTATIQLLDVILDVAAGRWLLLPGLLLFAVLFAVGATRLAGQPLWHAAAWLD